MSTRGNHGIVWQRRLTQVNADRAVQANLN
jgi:hypothetical protein